MNKYRICWESKETGKEGHGQPIFDSKESAEEMVHKLNLEIPNIKHWVELVKVRND